jgi:hypothetical protein
VADGWTFTSQAGAKASRVEAAPGTWAQLVDGQAGAEPPDVMLSQHGLRLERDRWYRLSLRARAEGFTADSLTVAVQNTAGWKSLFDYQRFKPGAEWATHTFTVQANDTADTTRFQIWYRGRGKLWLSDVRLEPIADPAAGRWLDGLYLDRPAEWDDPYRFFRW